MAQTAVATAPTDVSERAATFHGTVNPDSIDSDAWFEYGLTTSYGSYSNPIDVGSGASGVPISATVSNLQPGHTYHYRAVIAPSGTPPVTPTDIPPPQPGGSGNPQPPPSGATGATKPNYHWKLTPGYYASQDGPDANYQAVWLGAQNGTFVIDRFSIPTVYVAFQFKIDSSWNTGAQGQWGRMLNYHNTSLETNCAGWCTPPGTSALAIDYYGGNLTVNIEPNNSPNVYTIQAGLSKNVLHTVAMKTVLARGSGSVRIALNGVDKVNATGVNTIYDFGSGIIQRYMWLWTGFYSKAISSVLECDMCYPWIGATGTAALANPIGGEGGAWALSNIPIPGASHPSGPGTITSLTAAPASGLVLPAWFV